MAVLDGAKHLKMAFHRSEWPIATFVLASTFVLGEHISLARFTVGTQTLSPLMLQYTSKHWLLCSGSIRRAKGKCAGDRWHHESDVLNSVAIWPMISHLLAVLFSASVLYLSKIPIYTYQ